MHRPRQTLGYPSVLGRVNAGRWLLMWVATMVACFIAIGTSGGKNTDAMQESLLGCRGKRVLGCGGGSNLPLGKTLKKLWDEQAVDPLGELAVARGTFDIAFNPSRGKKRRTTIWNTQQSMQTPFNSSLFNFHKIPAYEVLFYFSPVPWHGCSCTPVENLDPAHFVMTNKFPLSRYSGILAPYVRENRSQHLTSDALEVGMRFAASLLPLGRDFRVGFNSLAAGASVNHLHFQFWSYHGPREGGVLPVEEAEKVLLAAHKYHPDLRIYSLKKFQVPGFAIRNISFYIDIVSDLLSRVIAYLYAREQPYNLLFASNQVFIMPRQPTSQTSLIRGVLPPGFPEIFGEVIATDTSLRDLSGSELSEHYEKYIKAPEGVLQGAESILVEGDMWERTG
eukprot:TRINITY_DN2862_c1_g1_i1.p1 TRINITY_DN2862_c1_g1~~TRINITY_DN2862_c1_g1_i1.p1  ORF type:complete len:408 (+),score=57.09 TRINITY_DN2862_c1_g1_i1:48-1226(+)